MYSTQNTLKITYNINLFNKSIMSSKLINLENEYYNYEVNAERDLIEEEKRRVTTSMCQDIVQLKQKLLSEKWMEITRISQKNSMESIKLINTYPSLINSLSLKYPKRKQFKKSSSTLFTRQGLANLKVSLSQTVCDLCQISNKVDSSIDIKDGDYKIMITQSGQKWVVKITEVSKDIFNITYCDGSCSQLSKDELNSLGVRFTPVKEKSS